MKYLLSLFWLLAAAVAQADPLPAEEVFKPEIHQSATADGYRTEVTIHFPDGYYLYADKATLGGVVGEESRTPAEAKEDPYLGPTQVWHQPPTITLSHRDRADTFTLKTQGCEENVICYPPTSWTLQVPPAEVAPMRRSWRNGRRRQMLNPPTLPRPRNRRCSRRRKRGLAGRPGVSRRCAKRHERPA